jgi:hypothetical protein
LDANNLTSEQQDAEGDGCVFYAVGDEGLGHVEMVGLGCDLDPWMRG